MSAIKQVAAAALLALAALVCAWLAGANHNEQKWLARQATIERVARIKYEAEVVRGDKAAGAYLAENRSLKTDYRDLTEKFNALRKRTPLVVAAAGHACSVRPADSAASQMLEATPDEVIKGMAADTPVAYLSAGAVWMWNSALTGKDQPANTCSALDPTAPACAVATNITLEDAWDNHATNAQICAENRLAHQRLIDFLNQREPRPERVKP